MTLGNHRGLGKRRIAALLETVPKGHSHSWSPGFSRLKPGLQPPWPTFGTDS